MFNIELFHKIFEDEEETINNLYNRIVEKSRIRIGSDFKKV